MLFFFFFSTENFTTLETLKLFSQLHFFFPGCAVSGEITIVLVFFFTISVFFFNNFTEIHREWKIQLLSTSARGTSLSRAMMGRGASLLHREKGSPRAANKDALNGGEEAWPIG